jgi:hypothetical protein
MGSEEDEIKSKQASKQVRTLKQARNFEMSSSNRNSLKILII